MQSSDVMDTINTRFIEMKRREMFHSLIADGILEHFKFSVKQVFFLNQKQLKNFELSKKLDLFWN